MSRAKGSGATGGTKRKGGAAVGVAEAARGMPCLGCRRVKLKCEGGYPCRRYVCVYVCASVLNGGIRGAGASVCDDGIY
jgi:hypothetical protein